MKGCLDGIRVLELGNFISGPYGAMLLADMGAEVIKVENPKGGDPFRGWDFGGDQPNFWAYNRGKKSVTLNLQTPEGKEVFYGLVKKADVVMDNYRPGVTKKLAIDFESLEQDQSENHLLLDHRHRPVRSLRQASGVRHRRARHGRHDERADGSEGSQAGRSGLRRLLERHVLGAWEFWAR